VALSVVSSSSLLARGNPQRRVRAFISGMDTGRDVAAELFYLESGRSSSGQVRRALQYVDSTLRSTTTHRGVAPARYLHSEPRS
jgi:hypothetical protein